MGPEYSREELTSRCRLWIWLAETERELGLDISDEAISQMKANVTMTDEDFEVAATEEKSDPRLIVEQLGDNSYSII